jgi:adenylate cyclase
MGHRELKDEVSEEVATILAADFQIDVVETESVPHSDDPAITFPNLDSKKQGTKLIDTCVLYIDIRRSTELNLTHKQQTVAKLYSAFVRAMTRCAREHKGHVRGIIGDRVMVIFDRKDCFKNAVECAIAMNSVSKYVINKHFKRGEVECGIGIDAGKMLATKTGVRRHGVNQNAYRSLVWLGRPANVASKLTDLANKPEDGVTFPFVRAAFSTSPFDFNWVWRDIYATDFIQQLDMVNGQIVHNYPHLRSMRLSEDTYVRRPATAPILMTEVVWNGFKRAVPTDLSVQNNWFEPIDLVVTGYTGKVYSGDVIFKIYNP